MLIHGEVLSVEQVNAHVQAVTLEDVTRVARSVLSRDRVLAVVGPFREEEFAARVA